MKLIHTYKAYLMQPILNNIRYHFGHVKKKIQQNIDQSLLLGTKLKTF